MVLEDLTREERSLLLYLESRSVDNRSLVDVRRMNKEDMTVAKKWNDTGFVNFGRIAFESLERTGNSSYWCKLSDDAWKLAHEERRARAKRMYDKRKWETTIESRQTEEKK